MIILRNDETPKSNINKPKFEALKALNNNPGIVILKADKGGSVIILNREDYHRKT